jgi:hypothetical protein
MTPCHIRVLFRDVLGRLAVCIALLAFAAGQETRAPDQEIQFRAMKKFEFLVGKWSGSGLWFTRQGVLNLIATDDVHYEQNGLTLMLRAQERQADGTPVGFSVLRICYDDKSNIYRVRTDPRHKEKGTLKIDDDWRGMTIQFKMPERTTLEMLRVNEKGEWAEVHWVTEGSDPPWMFLQTVVRRQKALRTPK